MRFGRYDLLEKLSEGGMGEVFRARVLGIEGFEKLVAVKRIFPHLSQDESYRRLFIREAKLTAPLIHPNIVQVLDLGEQDGLLFLAMELVDGTDGGRILRCLAENGKVLSPGMAAVLAFDVLEALDFAHRQTDATGHPLRIVHRDVSPQNILVDRQTGLVKICDFGVALAVRGSGDLLSGKIVGKLKYMAPEQARTEAVDERADLYGLGVVLYELTTGRELFPADSSIRFSDFIKSPHRPKVLDANRDVPAPLAALIDRSLEPDPAARYRTSAELRADIESFLEHCDPRAERERLRQLACHLAGVEAPPARRNTSNPTDIEAGLVRWTQLLARVGPVTGASPTEPVSVVDLAAPRPGSVRRRVLGRAAVGAALVALAVGAWFSLARGPAADRSGPEAAVVQSTNATPAPDSELASADEDSANDAPAKRSRRKGTGYLNLNVRPWAKVVIDGKPVERSTPLLKYPLSPGRHELVLLSPEGKSRRMPVEIVGGKTVTRIVNLE